MSSVLYVTQEYAPLFTEGGLGLTSRALPAALQEKRGVHHTLVLPFYPGLVAEKDCRTEQLDLLPPVTVGGMTADASVHRLLDHGGPCEVILIRSDPWYDRGGIYRDTHYVEFPDAVARAAFFGRCVAEWLRRSGRRFNLVHGNDWQSGAALAHIRAEQAAGPGTPLLMNLHSGLYHGVVHPAELNGLGLPPAAVAVLQQAAAGQPSLLLLGLLAADAAVTCSPTYARELGEAFTGHPIGTELRRLTVSGIVSGVDQDVWNPAGVGRPSSPYNVSTVTEGKRVNKRTLQAQLGLRVADGIPLFGVCSRLVEEKGVDLLIESLADLIAAGEGHLVVVGPAVDRFGEALRALVRRHPDAVHHHPRFDQNLAWQVYAAADFTVMPSRAEPCGLNQLIAMAYGTIPIVTAVGGLRDTVVDLRHLPGSGNGFVSPAVTAEGFGETVRQAVDWLHTHPDEVNTVRRRCMRADWSWLRTATEFAQLYQGIMDRRPGPLQSRQPPM